jgi:hypothetical protein
MADVIERLTAADPELGQPDPVNPPADLLASIMDGTDIGLSLRQIDSVPPLRRRSPFVAAFAGFAAVLVAGVVTFLIINTPSGPEGAVGLGDSTSLITTEMILEDGVVTEEEYRAGVEAVVACLADAGFEVEADYDNTNGHAGFSGGGDTGPATLEESLDNANPYRTAFDGCLEVHLSLNVSLGWGATLGRIDLGELREETTAVLECVENRTGEDFGELAYDGFGYLTQQGQQTREAAFEFQDHEPWTRCQNDLGYLDRYRAETKAILECVENRTGEDFGELEYDESGMLTAEGQQTLRSAVTYQNDVPWNVCAEELGLD